MAQKDMNMPTMTESGKRGITIPLLSSALIIVAVIAIYFYWQNVQLQKNPQSVVQQQIKDLVTKVGHLILLPEGETPTIATITDPSLLKSQAFFINAQKGDQILIYTNAKEAILYRPVSNIIINVAPLTIGNNTSPTTTPTPKTKP